LKSASTWWFGDRRGASRAELCSNLLEGGVTPSAGVIELMRSEISAGLRVMIRPGRLFFYSPEEFETMRRDIMVGKKLGVLGILDAHDNLDIARFARIGRTGRAFEMFADRFLRWKKVAPLEQTGF
jgi:copper homeostasis protein CutC